MWRIWSPVSCDAICVCMYICITKIRLCCQVQMTFVRYFAMYLFLIFPIPSLSRSHSEFAFNFVSVNVLLIYSAMKFFVDSVSFFLSFFLCMFWLHNVYKTTKHIRHLHRHGAAICFIFFCAWISRFSYEQNFNFIYWIPKIRINWKIETHIKSNAFYFCVCFVDHMLTIKNLQLQEDADMLYISLSLSIRLRGDLCYFLIYINQNTQIQLFRQVLWQFFFDIYCLSIHLSSLIPSFVCLFFRLLASNSVAKIIFDCIITFES